MMAYAKTFVLAAALAATTLASTGGAQASNVYPLAFGMTPQQAADALQSSLVYLRGRRGAEVFVTQRRTGAPSLYPMDERVWLQFRRGTLTGWKMHWRVRKGWLF